MPTNERSAWHAKTMALVKKYNLGFLGNPGGGQFTNRERGIDIQVHWMDDEEDYQKLVAGLKKLGFETDA